MNAAQLGIISSHYGDSYEPAFHGSWIMSGFWNVACCMCVLASPLGWLKHSCFMGRLFPLHSGRLRWNLKMMVWKMIFSSNG